MLLNNVIIADSGRKVNIRVSKDIIEQIYPVDAPKHSPLESNSSITDTTSKAWRTRDSLPWEGEGRGLDGQYISAIPLPSTSQPNTPLPGEGINSRGESPPPTTFDELKIDFTNAIIFPGLINSHDHLDFNLFPQLGNRKYNNYSEWGTYIHKAYKNEIEAVLKVPQALRSQWGMYKNLLCGVTTVVNHGSGSDIANKLITIFDDKHDLHSVGFDNKWKLRLNNPLKRKLPVVIHAGEGTDDAAVNEIDALIKGNKLHRIMVAVHGVAMQPKQALKFNALVWCPASNYFLLNKTAPVDKLKLYTQLLFGTDSTLTGDWDIWEHIHLAHKEGLLNNHELYNTLNRNAAQTWKLNSGELSPNKHADMVVAKMKAGESSIGSFFSLTPADILLVMHKGEIRIVDESIYLKIKDKLTAQYTRVKLADSYKYVQGDLGGLIKTIQHYLPQALFPFEVQAQG